MGNILLILLGIGTAFSFLWLMHCRDRLSINTAGALGLALLHTCFGVLCVKVFAVMETLDLNNIGNMSLFGGLFFMPVFYYLLARIFHWSIADTFDIFTPCMVFTVMCARVNCIFAGCCRGKIIPGTDMRWPTRQAEIIFYIFLLIHIIRKVNNRQDHGMMYPLYMYSYGIFRFMNELFRDADTASLFHIAHVWCIIALSLGLSVSVEIQNRNKKLAERGKARGRK